MYLQRLPCESRADDTLSEELQQRSEGLVRSPGVLHGLDHCSPAQQGIFFSVQAEKRVSKASSP